MAKVSKELVSASLSLITLSIFAQGDNYGYDILKKVKDLSKGRINCNEGVIYPVLKKMEAKGMIKSYWVQVENDRPRKYYNLLDGGFAELERQKYEWNMVNDMLNQLWKSKTN